MVAEPDILGSDPARPRPARPPRLVLIAVTALAAVTAAVLAARSAPGPSNRAAPRPPAPSVAYVSPVLRAPHVSWLAVGTRYAYALVDSCDSAAVQACSHRLHRRAVDGTEWTETPLRTETRSTVGGFLIAYASGADGVTVLDGPAPTRSWTSSDAGETFTERPVRVGPPLDRVPPDGVVTPWGCPDCGAVTVFDPASGQLRPLRVQPFRAAPRAVEQDGDVLWAVAEDGTASASTDGGRTWRSGRLPPATATADGFLLLTAPGGGAYALTGRVQGNDSTTFTGGWRIDRPGGAWRPLDRSGGPRTLRSAGVGDRGLLLVDDGGTAWRYGPEGRFARLPEPGPSRPADLVTGPGRLVVALVRGDIPEPVVLVSRDEGETWAIERLGA